MIALSPALSLVFHPRDNNSGYKLTLSLILALVVWLLVAPSLLSAFAGLGGYISEKTLGDGTNEALVTGFRYTPKRCRNKRLGTNTSSEACRSYGL